MRNKINISLVKLILGLILFNYTDNAFGRETKSTSNIDSLIINETNVTVNVTNEGSTIEELRLNAFRNAIEQAYGTFISSNTVILNDKVVRDEIVSLSNGNIIKYDIIDERKTPSGIHIGNYRVIVSINKLKSFCIAKGIKVQFEGGLFAVNIKLQALAEESEYISIRNTLYQLNPILNKAFNYKATVYDPISVNSNKEFLIRLVIDCIVNENLNFVFEYLNNVLNSISLNTEEQKSYLALNKPIYPIKINDKIYFVRNKRSFDFIQIFFNEVKYIQRRFRIIDGVKNRLASLAHFKNGGPYERNTDLIINKIQKTHHDWRGKSWSIDTHDSQNIWSDSYSGLEDIDQNENSSWAPGNFSVNINGNEIQGIAYKSRPIGDIIKTYDISTRYTINELEKINSFTIEHNSKYSKVSEWANGGVIFYEDSLQYLIHPIGFNPSIFRTEQYCRKCEDRECPTIKLCPIDSYNNTSPTHYENGKLKISYATVITGTVIGSGKVNTNKLSLATNKFTDQYGENPFGWVQKYSNAGYKDWFIPSLLEAKELLEYRRSYMTISENNIDLMTSSKYKEIKYGIDWDSFHEIQQLDFEDYENKKGSIYYTPILSLPSRLFEGNNVNFIPIRKESKLSYK